MIPILLLDSMVSALPRRVSRRSSVGNHLNQRLAIVTSRRIRGSSRPYGPTSLPNSAISGSRLDLLPTRHHPHTPIQNA
jgi:hypothetical protein